MTRTATAGPGLPAGAGRRPWPSWAVALALFAGSRVVTTLLFAWVRTQGTPLSRAGVDPSPMDLATAWDGAWYWRIGLIGYPSVLPTTPSGAVDTNEWAFLPLYPFLSRLLTFGVLDWRVAALAVSVASGFGTAVLLLVLLERRTGRRDALFAVALFSCSPLSFILQTTYAESLGLLLLTGALVLVDRRRYWSAVPVALLLAVARPGVLALSLAVGVLLALRLVRARRGGPAVPRDQALGAAALAVSAALAGLAWPVVAAAVTGRPDAYFATEGAWRALWMPEGEARLLQPWFFAAEFWAGRLVGAGAAVVVGPVVLVLLVAGFAAALLLRPVRRLGPAVRLWLAAYALYLLAVFLPQSSLFRLLMPMAPLAGAIVPPRAVARVGVLAASLALQALWLWVVDGPVQSYWTVP